jgi:hypothetical protein
MSNVLNHHLVTAAEYSNRSFNVSYYFYHAWIAIRAGSIYLYIGTMSIVHAIFPFTFSGFSLAALIVKQSNQVRQSIPDWDGWEKLENWKDEKYK